MAVAQWVRRRSSGLRVVEAEGSGPWWRIYTKSFFSNDLISALLGLMDFRDIVILRSRPNGCCQQKLKCFDMPLLSLGLFSGKSSNDC